MSERFKATDLGDVTAPIGVPTSSELVESAVLLFWPSYALFKQQDQRTESTGIR
jgi:hypothetical protein